MSTLAIVGIVWIAMQLPLGILVGKYLRSCSPRRASSRPTDPEPVRNLAPGLFLHDLGGSDHGKIIVGRS